MYSVLAGAFTVIVQLHRLINRLRSTGCDAADSVRSQHCTLNTALDREQIADNLHLHQAKCLSHYVELSLAADVDVTANNAVMMMMVVT